jgi:peptidoglycan L-alanyl-D-glutamate endopeptidase CwlK
MLTARDRKRLAGVHPDLVRVVERARRDVEFYVAEGVRSIERQRELVAKGVSKTMDSRHITGHAVDLYPVSDVPVPAMTARDLAPVVSAMKRAAHAECVPMVHGADWGWDHPHHELARSRYP